MGLRFRKSFNFGPFRLNLSKSGVGYSVGGKGFRVTKKAGGGVRTTTSIPGTGISYVQDTGGKKEEATVDAPQKSKFKVLILAIFFGIFGAHRFYTGKVGTGFLWLFTGGLVAIGWIVDIIAILSGAFCDKYGRPLIKD